MPSKTEDLWWLFTRQTIKVTPRQSVLTASMIMQRRNFRHLPVVDEKGRIMGMISAQDIIDSLNFVLSRPDLRTDEVIESLEIPVERIMVYNSICVEPGDGLAEITKKMTFHNLGGMPVVDEQGVVHGIITLRDLVALMGTSSDEIGVPVSEIMNPNVITIDQKGYLSTAVRLMSEHRIRRLPVVPGGGGADAGAPKGILSNKDALGHLAKVAATGVAGPNRERAKHLRLASTCRSPTCHQGRDNGEPRRRHQGRRLEDDDLRDRRARRRRLSHGARRARDGEGPRQDSLPEEGDQRLDDRAPV